MKRLHFAAILSSFALLAGKRVAAQDKKPKAPELKVLQISVRRIDDKLIAVDGSVENTGPKPYNKMLLVFEFFAPGKQSITIQKGPTEMDVFPPGEIAEFHLQLRAPARAVEVLLGAEDGNGRELRLSDVGPYPVE
jgi:hypothetical protein